MGSFVAENTQDVALEVERNWEVDMATYDSQTKNMNVFIF